MRDRTPVSRDQREPLPAFAPVPRRARHDGWTAERQRAFIEALADSGSVSRAAAMVNMSTEGAYYLRRQPGADEFRRAWEAALDYGVARMKDIAFERAVEGTLSPVMAGGRLIGWRRIYNDRLLMFCLRHYGEDAGGKRTTVNYFSTRASAGAGAGDGAGAEGLSAQASAASAEASSTTVRTTIASHGTPDDLAASLGATAATLDGFAGIALDPRAEAEIRSVLEACAARHRAVEGTPGDEAEPFVAALQPPREMLVYDEGYARPRRAVRRPPPAHYVTAEPEELLDQDHAPIVQPEDQHRSGPAEMDWRLLDDEQGMAAIEAAVESVRQAKRDPPAAEPAPRPAKKPRQ